MGKLQEIEPNWNGSTTKEKWVDIMKHCKCEGSILNTFVNEIKEIKIPIIEEKITYELKAIIADYVLINDIWIKKNENLNDFKLIEINKDYVLLQNDEKILKLELANEEYLKNIY